MDHLHLTTLDGIPLAQIRDSLNAAFADYEISFRYSLELLETKFIVESIEPRLSVGVFRGKALVAFILHGCRPGADGDIIYNGGTGVIPGERGQGLTVKMYDYILPQLKGHGADFVTLEVLSSNTPAIKSYRKTGFATQRELACYTGPMTLPVAKANDLTIERIDWSTLDTIAGEANVLPSWQNATASLKKLKSAVLIGAYRHGNLCAYAVVNPDRERLQQIYVVPGARRQGVATSLLRWTQDHVTQITDVSNVDTRAAGLAALYSSCGMVRKYDQYEMRVDL
jgi:ribosomal protein S18 acetylase RimI-like enzyme